MNTNLKWINTGNKILLILSWIPWSGKSTWIKENNLEKYTISSDVLRLMVWHTILDLEVWESISQDYNKESFKFFYDILDTRMNKWLFTVCDATHLLEKDFNKYFDLARKYWYKLYIKQINETNKEVLLKRNENRGIYKISEEIIDLYLDRYKNFTIPKGIEEIKTVEDLPNYCKNYKVIEKDSDVYYIWDIQSCPKELKTFLDKYYNTKDYFVFTGDLLDRGYDSVWVLDIIYNIIDNPKVILIKWNHDNHLIRYVEMNRKVKVGSTVFDEVTQNEIKDYPIEKLRKIASKFVLSTHFQIWGKRVFASHWGISHIPDFIIDKQLIRWVGAYNFSEICDNKFQDWALKQTDTQYFSVHWHRNQQQVGIQSTTRTFNLEWQIEFGWELRVVKFGKDWKTELIDIPSTVIPKDWEINLLEKFKRNKLIKVKDLWEDLYSINFTREAFYNQSWTTQTVKARGLFIWKNNEIYARSYEKFFNVWERSETTMPKLAENLWFPVKVYHKYNWFLGIVGMKDWKVLYLSKTSNSSDFAKLVEKHLKPFEAKLIPYLNKWYSLIFEICDKTDEHIVREEERAILIEMVKNNIVFEKIPYNELLKVGNDIWVEVKKEYKALNNIAELSKFLEENKSVDFEGFILEGSTWFMSKTKSLKYLFWKEIRGDIRKLSNNPNAEVLHRDTINALINKWVDIFNCSIPDLIEASDWLNIKEIPRRNFDVE